MGLSMFYNTRRPDDERLKFLDYAHTKGATFWDSADVYADNEDIIGKYVETRHIPGDVFPIANDHAADGFKRPTNERTFSSPPNSVSDSIPASPPASTTARNTCEKHVSQAANGSV